MNPCLPPRETITVPAWRSPAGGCDCHFHIFGPFERYPLSPRRSYTPSRPAPVAAYRRVADTLGLDRGIVVQASIHGTDNACTLDAVAELGPGYRAVVVVDATVTDADLRAMDARGARGVRFNIATGGGTPIDELDAIVARIAPLGWHLQVFTTAEHLAELAPRLGRLPVPLVIDHMGGAQAADGTETAGVRALRRLLDAGRTWVKLSGYRASAGPPYSDVAPLARALLAAAPERCVWGTDWPHPNMAADVPDDGELFDLLGAWAPDEAARRRVLVDNPAALYGFGAAASAT